MATSSHAMGERCDPRLGASSPYFCDGVESHFIKSGIFLRTVLPSLKTLVESGEMSPDMVFLDHVNLSALGLKDNLSSEQDLENAILREIEIVLGELGSNFAFIKRQYRFRVDKRTYSIDLLFYNRRLRALVAAELKLGEFEPAHMGQMELYLRWLEKHEMLPGESRPYGLVLCAEASREHIELLRLGDVLQCLAVEIGVAVDTFIVTLEPRQNNQLSSHRTASRSLLSGVLCLVPLLFGSAMWACTSTVEIKTGCS